MQPIGCLFPADLEAGAASRSPYRRLSYAWHTFTPEWAAAYDVSDEDLARFAGERRSKVTFDIEPLGEMVKLTVVHDGFEPGSAILPGITEGWPASCPTSRPCWKPAARSGGAILPAGRPGRQPHGVMRGLEGVLGHAEQVVPQGVEVDVLP
jgi:hypothetical protein